MKNLIRTILKEEFKKPKWFVDWEALPTEGRIAGIEERKEQILKILPTMVNFFEEKFSGYLEEIVVAEKSVHYGSEVYSTRIPLLRFYFDELPRTEYPINKEIKRDIEGFFGIDISYYGVPLDFETFGKTWTQITR